MPYGSIASEPGSKRLIPIPDPLNHIFTLLGPVRSVVWTYLIDTAGTQGFGRRVIEDTDTIKER